MKKTPESAATAISLLALSMLLACGDRRDVWSISTTAIAQLPLEQEFEVRSGLLSESAALPCQSILSLRLAEALPDAASADQLRSTLESSSQVKLDCFGSCGEEDHCIVHHTLSEYPNPKSAVTSCICGGVDPGPCSLNVQWAAGQKARRQIEEIACQQNTEFSSCELSISRKARTLEIGCEEV